VNNSATNLCIELFSTAASEVQEVESIGPLVLELGDALDTTGSAVLELEDAIDTPGSAVASFDDGCFDLEFAKVAENAEAEAAEYMKQAQLFKRSNALILKGKSDPTFPFFFCYMSWQ